MKLIAALLTALISVACLADGTYVAIIPVVANDVHGADSTWGSSSDVFNTNKVPAHVRVRHIPERPECGPPACPLTMTVPADDAAAISPVWSAPRGGIAAVVVESDVPVDVESEVISPDYGVQTTPVAKSGIPANATAWFFPLFSTARTNLFAVNPTNRPIIIRHRCFVPGSESPGRSHDLVVPADDIISFAADCQDPPGPIALPNLFRLDVEADGEFYVFCSTLGFRLVRTLSPHIRLP